MRALAFVIAATLLTAATPAQESKIYKGVITETMCGRQHTMNINPDATCVRECVGDGKTYRYALAVGDSLYTLSDQETPAKFAAQKVEVTGVLYMKTNIIKVERIKAVK